MKKLLNSTVRTLLTAKISLGAFLSEKEIELGLVSNLNDCFLISPECSANMEVLFSLPNSYMVKTEKKRNETIAELEAIEERDEHEEQMLAELKEIKETRTQRISPIEGDKFIGNNRDKGSVTKVMTEYVPYFKFKFENKEQYERFYTFVCDLGKVIVNDNPKEFYFETQVDVVAHTSTARDNVSALVLNSLLEYEAIVEDKPEYQLSIQEALDIDVVEFADKYPCGFEVVLKDCFEQEVYSFGKVPMMIEDFFWQPQHGNRFAIKEKEISLNYNQARDALKVLTPTLAEVVKKSANFNSIKEDMSLLGLKIGTPTDINSGIMHIERVKPIDSIIDGELI